MATADAARAIAASIINGDINEVTHATQAHVLRHAHEYLPLRHGPVVSVSDVQINDTTITPGDDDGYTVERFGIRRKYPYVWPTGKTVVTYKTGWTPGAEPTGVQEALTMLETWIDTNPEASFTSISIGGESATRDAQAGAKPPAAAITLLQPWVRPWAP